MPLFNFPHSGTIIICGVVHDILSDAPEAACFLIAAAERLSPANDNQVASPVPWPSVQSGVMLPAP